MHVFYHRVGFYTWFCHTSRETHKESISTLIERQGRKAAGQRGHPLTGHENRRLHGPPLARHKATPRRGSWGIGACICRLTQKGHTPSRRAL